MVSDRVKSYLILSMAAVYLLHSFLPFHFLTVMLALITTVVFIINLPGTRPAPKYFTILMFSVGLMIHLQMGRSFDVWMDSVITNVPLITLIMLVPLISIPLKMGGFINSVHEYMIRLARRPRKLFMGITFFLFSLGPVLNLGSIRLIHEIVHDLNMKSSFLARAYLTGFSTVILWSPYFASVALVLYYLDIPVSEYIPVGLPIAFLQWVIGNLIFRVIACKKKEVAATGDHPVPEYPVSPFHRRHVQQLAVLILILMAIVLLLETLTGWSMMLLVSLVAILFPLVWVLFDRRFSEWRTHIEQFRDQSVPRTNNEIVMFISAGVFGKALTGTVVADMISAAVQQLSSISFLVLAMAIVLVMFLLTFMGIHPIVIVIPLLTQIDPATVGATPAALALVFMLAWAISAVSSPVNPLNLLVSGSVNESAIRTGVKWNGFYLLSMFIIGMAYIYVINSFAG